MPEAVAVNAQTPTTPGLPAHSLPLMLANETAKGLLILSANLGTLIPELAVLIVFYLFIQFFSLVVNPDTTLNAKKTVTITVSLNASGTQMSGGYSFVVIDPTGHVITMGSGTVSGQKIPHPLLP